MSNRFTMMKKYKDRLGANFLSGFNEKLLSYRRLPVDRFALNNDLKIVLAKIGMITILPLVLMWSIRTIFNADIELNFKTWFAGVLLVTSLRLIFKDLDGYRDSEDEEFYEEDETDSQTDYHEENDEESRTEYYGKKYDEKDKTIFFEEKDSDKDKDGPAEHVLELSEMVGARENFVTRKEFVEEIHRMHFNNGFVTRKELIEELGHVLMALTKKESHLSDDR